MSINKRKIKPFNTQSGFTIFNNFVLDNIMPNLQPNAWKCLCFIIRKTIGWQKAEDKLSFSQIREGTGIKSDATVSRALVELEEAKYVIVSRSKGQWDTNTYILNTTLEIEVADASTTETVVVSTTETVVVSTTETVDTKERNKDKQTEEKDRSLSTGKEEGRSDYLSLVVEANTNGGVSETTAPRPIDQWWEYRDETINHYAKTLGLKLNEAQRGELGNLAGEEGFEVETYKDYIDKFAIHGGYKYDVAAAIKGYWIYQKTGNIYKALGRRGLAAGDQGGGTGKVIQNEDGSYYL